MTLGPTDFSSVCWVSSVEVPAWVEDLPADSPLGRQWAKTASLDLFAREPGVVSRKIC